MTSALQVASLFATLDLKDTLTPGLKSAQGGLSGFVSKLDDAMLFVKQLGPNLTKYATLPILGFAAAAIKSFSDSETAVAQLDAVLRSTSLADGTFTESTTASADDLEKLNTKLGQSKEKIEAYQMQLANSGAGANTNLIIDKMNKEMENLDKLSAMYDAGSRIKRNYIKISHLTRDELIALSKAFQTTTRFSDEDVLSAENLLLTFTNIGKDVFPDATKVVLDMSTALGQDLKSSAVQLGKALQDPVEGITALRRVGVNFSDSQKAIIENMIATGNLAGAQKLILQELNTEFGGSAEAAGKKLPGALDILKNKWGEFLEKIGEKMAPDVKNAVQFLSDLMDELIKLPSGVIEAGIGIVAFIAVLGPAISVATSLGTAIGFLATAFTGLLIPIGLVALPLLIIGGLIAAYQTNWMGFRDTVDRIGIAIRQLVQGLIDLNNALAQNAVSRLLGGTVTIGQPLPPGGTTGPWVGGHVGGSADGSLDAALRGGGSGGSFMRDSGGKINANEIFGSAVPELFLPKQSGMAIPLDQLKGGGGDTYIVNANFGKVATPDDIAQGKREVFEGIIEAKRRSAKQVKGR